MLENELRNPAYAAGVASMVTATYVYITKKDDDGFKNSTWTKPALMVGILVYVIVKIGIGNKETLMKEPF